MEKSRVAYKLGARRPFGENPFEDFAVAPLPGTA